MTRDEVSHVTRAMLRATNLRECLRRTLRGRRPEQMDQVDMKGERYVKIKEGEGWSNAAWLWVCVRVSHSTCRLIREILGYGHAVVKQP